MQNTTCRVTLKARWCIFQFTSVFFSFYSRCAQNELSFRIFCAPGWLNWGRGPRRRLLESRSDVCLFGATAYFSRGGALSNALLKVLHCVARCVLVLLFSNVCLFVLLCSSVCALWGTLRNGPFLVPFLTWATDDGISYCDSITTSIPSSSSSSSSHLSFAFSGNLVSSCHQSLSSYQCHCHQFCHQLPYSCFGVFDVWYFSNNKEIVPGVCCNRFLVVLVGLYLPMLVQWVSDIWRQRTWLIRKFMIVRAVLQFHTVFLFHWGLRHFVGKLK